MTKLLLVDLEKIRQSQSRIFRQDLGSAAHHELMQVGGITPDGQGGILEIGFALLNAFHQAKAALIEFHGVHPIDSAQ
jgi:hypothetical protein